MLELKHLQARLGKLRNGDVYKNDGMVYFICSTKNDKRIVSCITEKQFNDALAILSSGNDIASVDHTGKLIAINK